MLGWLWKLKGERRAYTTVPGNVLGLNLHEFRNNRDNPQSIKATWLKISYTQGFCVYRYYEVVLETSVEKFKRYYRT